jgi:hypothetical protein
VSDADPKIANSIRNKQKKERETINSDIRSSNSKIKEINTELEPLRKEDASFAAEVGPIKYIADLVYGEESNKYLDNAIRWVIIIIVMVFDPLAIILLIAANIGLNKKLEKPSVERKSREKKDKSSWIDTTKEFLDKKKNDVIRINRKSIMKID